MITKDQFIASVSHEISIIRHLAEKIGDADMDFRPTEGQRSVRELLQYLTYILVVGVESLTNPDPTLWQKATEEAAGMTLADFDGRMAAADAKIKELVTVMTDAQLAEEVDMWGKRTRAMHLLNMHKWASAYKMQLFLYMKQHGHSNLNTMNLWAGMDGSVG